MKRLTITFLAVIILLTLIVLLKPVVTPLINAITHQRKVTLNTKSYNISFYIPSYLYTQQEIDAKQTNESFTNINDINNFYSSDKKVNNYYYQTSGMDFLVMVRDPSEPYTENIPFSIAKKTTLTIPAGKVTLYVYPSADGDGHGRGKLGSVHQGEITFDEKNNIGLAFACYDHSSGASVSQRCSKTVQLLFKSVRLHKNILSIFFQ